MTPTRRQRCLALVVIAGLWGLGACGGAQPTTALPAFDSPFTELPSGDEDPETVFLAADAAFRAGDMVSAQRLFGTLFIVAPQHRGGVAPSAVQATCDTMGVDCAYVFSRLELLRDAHYGRFGDRGLWVARQRHDFADLTNCYEAAMMGDYPRAVEIGAPLRSAPDPVFAYHADNCATRAGNALAFFEQQRRTDAALIVWQQHVPCMDQSRVALLEAARNDDWETFLGFLPGYRECASPLQSIIDSAVLEGDPRLGLEHDLVWSNMSEIDAVLEDHGDDLDRTQSGLAELATRSDYAELVDEWWQQNDAEQQLLAQRGDFERAASVLQGSAREGALAQARAIDEELRAVQSDKADVMRRINRIRTRLGLSELETP